MYRFFLQLHTYITIYMHLHGSRDDFWCMDGFTQVLCHGHLDTDNAIYWSHKSSASKSICSWFTKFWVLPATAWTGPDNDVKACTGPVGLMSLPLPRANWNIILHKGLQHPRALTPTAILEPTPRGSEWWLVSKEHSLELGWAKREALPR